MANKMLHRGSPARLSSTSTNLPILSTCLFLLVQFQALYALPTTSTSLSSNGDFRQQDAGVITSASSPSTAYGSAYPYNSYRPGSRLEDSYKPYVTYPKALPASPPSELYAPDHPNSVYSRQSSAPALSQNLDKVLQLIEKEIVASDLQQQQNVKISSNPLNANDKPTPEQKRIPLTIGNNNTPVRNNKPRLLPLPSISSTSSGTVHEIQSSEKKPKQEHHQNINIEHKQNQPVTTSTASGVPEEQQARSAEFSPMPPPFAPELDPQYERRQYGLGALTLLDQAGPFW